MKIYKFKKNNEDFKKVLIPRNGDKDNIDWLEITIDFTNNQFLARKVYKQMKADEEWEESQEFTFASFYLGEFMRRDLEEKENTNS